MGLLSVDISGFQSGVQKNKKPFLLVDDAFAELNNAYVWRNELKKRRGLQFIGRYRRVLTALAIGNSGASPWTINTIYSTLTAPITGETNAEIEPGSVVITIQTVPNIVFTDQGDGTLTSPTGGNSGTINYATGVVVLTHTAGAGVATIISFNYFPALPAMGIHVRETSGINDEQTIWFDTKYAYVHDGSDFQEFLPASAVTWNGTNSDFFWATNYRGTDSEDRLFFVTNFVNDVGSPMRYTDGATWATFQPEVSTTPSIYIFSARILIPYYGRLLALNTWEGTTNATAVNIYNRCRFSQIGSPIASDAWHSDVFGKGGFIDAPVNEEITSATFYKNTLIVTFERSTWRLQYIGEYGIPFIWERISSDFGSESTFSSVLFDSGVLTVGDKAIVGSSGNDVQRIDLDIPDTVYDFRNADEGVKRVHGIRDFKNELVFWAYPNYPTMQVGQFYPNTSLLYNYRNNTFAHFRNNVTCYGNFQYPTDITWDRLDVFWDSPVSWDSGAQSNYPVIVSGNQHGFAHFYGYPDVETSVDSIVDALDQESLAVRSVTVTTVVSLEIPDHNLLNDEVIYLTGLIYSTSTTLNDQIYMVQVTDKDNIVLLFWDVDTQQPITDFPVTNAGTYLGGGVVALFPRLEARTKDFNPMKQAGMNIKTSYVDFLFDSIPASEIAIRMRMNATIEAEGNLLVGNTAVEQGQSKSGTITNITLANPCVITSKNHGLLDDNEVLISSVVGTTELNGNNYTVTFINTDTFSLNVDSTAFTAYTSGGYWIQSKIEYFTLGSQYSWHRFFASCYGQYLSLVLTYNNDQMNRLRTHQQDFILNAMQIYYRPAGKNIFGK